MWQSTTGDKMATTIGQIPIPKEMLKEGYDKRVYPEGIAQLKTACTKLLSEGMTRLELVASLKPYKRHTFESIPTNRPGVLHGTNGNSNATMLKFGYLSAAVVITDLHGPKGLERMDLEFYTKGSKINDADLIMQMMCKSLGVSIDPQKILRGKVETIKPTGENMTTNTKTPVHGGLKDLQRVSESSLDVSGIAQLSRIFETRFASTYERYDKLLESHKGTYTIRDIEKFYSSQPHNVNTINLGLFISAAINRIITENDQVVLRNSGLSLHYLGTGMRRGTIIVEGKVMDNLGHKMKGGLIIVKGDAYNRVASFMCGGEIQVHGSVASNAADNMTGGRLVITHNAGYHVGNNASAGAQIIINGSYLQKAQNCRTAILKE
jgi:hypothetical protein